MPSGWLTAAAGDHSVPVFLSVSGLDLVAGRVVDSRGVGSLAAGAAFCAGLAAVPSLAALCVLGYLATPLPALHHGRIAWLGDAAHAMAPNLGQGGCQAIEDAVVLAHLLPAGSTSDAIADRIPSALAAYTAARRTRTDAVRVRARRAGRLGAVRNPLAAATRDLAVRATPNSLARRGLDDLFTGFRLPGR